MKTADAKKVAKAMMTIRDALAGASETEKEAIAGSLRALLEKAEPAKVAPVKATARVQSTPVTAAQVVTVARQVLRAGGGFGDNKAFISEVYDAIAPMTTLSLSAFKALLPGMNRRGELSLSRADLVEAMDPAKVDRSHVSHMSADFHFIRVEV